ncbi:MAG: L-2-hydroxyglutarate oxidase [Bacteroidetes bacterium]|nr:MAG: L-2-hydroxyglutarate oxidase [Bacteroidota bacterium]
MQDIVIIGGGIVGLATAFKLKEANPDLKITLLEKESELVKHQTGNNSGVIHSGLYYKPGSLKAINCINGYNMLLDFANQHNIKYNLCGKVVVATMPKEIERLENLYKRGIENGLTKIKKLNINELKEIEPHVNGLEGLYVPYTGIIDYVKVAEKMAELFKNNGGIIELNQKVIDIKNNAESSTVISSTNSFETKLIINCAGLYSDKIAAINKDKINLRIIPFRGEYFLLKPEKRYLVKTLIYPVPDPNFPFLGVHFTNMIGGDVECGPNAVFAFKKEGYKLFDFDFTEFWESITWPGFQKVAIKYWKTGLGEYKRSFSKTAFTKALQRLIPEIQKDDLIPTHAGVRAQACDRDGGLLDDFAIIEDKYIINVCNAPSPAATSSLSIGKTVSEMALKRFNN